MSRKSSPERLAKHAAWARNRYRTDVAVREAHKILVAANRAYLRQQTRSILAAAKTGGCFLCSESEPCCMSFHHVDHQGKEFNIGDANKKTVSLPRLTAEFAKCVRVCENCHRKIHAGLITVPPNSPRVIVPCPPPRSRASRDSRLHR